MKKILIVDDSEIIRRLIEEIVKANNVVDEVLTASDGEEAIVKIMDEKPDLILLDILMPKKTGLEVLDWMGSNNHTDIPVIVFSTDINQKFQALEKGAHVFLTKPVAKNDLLEVIEDFLSL